MKKFISLMLVCVSVLLTTSCDSMDMLMSRVKTNIADIADDFTVDEGEKATTQKIVDNSINVGMTEFDTFNPLLTKSQSVKEVLQLIYEPLFEIDAAMHVVPVLASSYSVSPDGLTYNITMKKDVVWHDGKTLDAYDAAYTMKHILAGNTQYSENLNDVADYRAVSNDTLRIVLKHAVPQFTALLSFPIVKYQTPMDGKKDYFPVGTGAFEYKGKVDIDEYILSAFGLYHNGRAKLDNIYIREAPDVERYRSMFEVSETDMISGKMLDLMTYMPKGKSRMNDFISNYVTYVGFNLKNKLLAENNTRTGLSNLIDKAGIVNSVLYSRGVATDVLVNPYSWLYYDLNTEFGAEREKAMQFFGNDGWGEDEDGYLKRTVNGKSEFLRLVMLVDEDNDIEYRIALRIKEDLEKGGVKVVLDEQSHEMYNIKLQQGNYDVFISSCNLGTNHDVSKLVGLPYFSYSNNDVNMLISQLGMTSEDETVMDIYKQLGEILKNDAPFVPLYYAKESVLVSAKIKNGTAPSLSGTFRVSNMWSVFE